MKRYSLYILASMAVVLAVSGCSGPQKSEVYLSKEFSLAIGESANLVSENLEVKFDEVIEDSRCPTGVTCFWTGRVSCVVEFTQEDSSYRMVLSEPGLTDEYSREIYKGYEISFHVTPYPEADKEISQDKYRLHLIINKLPELTKIIGSIIAEPSTFEGQEVTIVGYYRGWDLLNEANVSPPVTRSDWVIKDATGAIYVSALSEATLPNGLHHESLENTTTILRVSGTVNVTQNGQAYIQAKSIERVS